MCIACFLLVTGCNKDSVDNSMDKEGWELTFSEEFSDTILDTNVWRKTFYWGQSLYAETEQYYIDSAFFVKGGVLYIEGKKQTVTGTVYDSTNTPLLRTFEYTSGLINTSDAFAQQYGYFEIRCKSPYGQGFWPAFWLLVYDRWPPEIDVFEIKGNKPDQLHMANHFRNLEGGMGHRNTTIKGPNFSTDFHVFAIEWNMKEIIWYMDNTQVYRSEVGIPHEKMWMVINLAIGGNFSGFTDDSTPSPAYLEVDYVRVYRKR